MKPFLTSFLLFISINSFAGIGQITSSDSIICLGMHVYLFDTTIGGVWTSSDTSVATIDSSSGILVGISAGPATITYSVGSSFVVTTVTVHPEPSPISLSGSLCPGEVNTLYDTTAGGGTWFCYTCSTFNIISSTSNSVEIVGIALGSDNLIFADSFGCSTFENITVWPPPPPISGITTVNVFSTTTLSEAHSGSWISKDTAIATVGSTGIVTGVSTGIDTIYFFSGCPVYTVVTVLPPLEVSEMNPENEIKLNPNPVTSQLIISAPKQLTSLSITNLLGQIVYSQNSNQTQLQIDVSDFLPGIYFAKINALEVRKFVKQ